MRKISQSELFDDFRKAMIASGIGYNGEIIADGCFHRFHVDGDKQGSRNGWYVMYLHPVPCGVFGSWKTGYSNRWSIKPDSKLTRYEREMQRRNTKEAIRQQGEALQINQRNAAIKANNIFISADPANCSHPYLLRKRISRFTARQKGNLLILPICDFNDDLWSLQFIGTDGNKKLLAGGKKKGLYIPINGSLANSNTLLICEGFATGATLAQANPNFAVIAAVDCGNLPSVALNAREAFPRGDIIICADDDRTTKGNPGLSYANLAVVEGCASLWQPNWPAGAPDSLSDFNDLACWLEDNEEVII